MHTIIIGAGILGASAAFHLMSLGASTGEHVTIIDANLNGRATAAGAGIICPWVSGAEDEAFMRLYTTGGEYYPDLIAALADAGETDTGYHRSGAMLVAADEAEITWMDRMVRGRHCAPMGSITRLSPAEAQKAFPPLRKNLGAVHVEGGARVDGRRMTAALLRAAQHLGATFLHGEAQFTRSGTVTLNGTALQADTTILTAGAWADSILRPIGTRLPVEPQRGQIIHFQLPTQDTKDWPVILPPGSHYIVPFDDGRIVAGATRETGAGFDYRTTATGQHEVLTEALSIAPGLGQATILETRIGFRPASTGIRPFLGWVPSAENLLIGNGLGAAGLTIGPFAGRLLAEMALQRTPSIDPAPFSLTTRREATPAVALR